jgi:hypothetical protein
VQLGCGGCSLVGEPPSLLCCLVLSVVLLSVGAHSLLLLKSMSSLEGEAGVLPWCEHPRWNCRHGVSGQRVFRPSCGCGWSRQYPCVEPLGDRKAEASLSAGRHVELIGGVLDHGPQ